ncbi:hypothetical protein [Rhodopirellula bahusiensis]|uniref:hypothetical protein n=1 Tax=Rhodopirellula bahusiensis TaxID=2014065 RepID=UPI003264C800
MPRQDTKLESEGAEFLVLGHLLMHRIVSYKTYTNMPGYDLVATHPEHNTSARIQVKSRWRTGAPGFIIKNFDCDFVVIVKLNRGNKLGTGKVLAPEYYVVPTEILKEVPRGKDWGKVMFKSIPDFESYHEGWASIASFLQNPGSE